MRATKTGATDKTVRITGRVLAKFCRPLKKNSDTVCCTILLADSKTDTIVVETYGPESIVSEVAASFICGDAIAANVTVKEKRDSIYSPESTSRYIAKTDSPRPLNSVDDVPLWNVGMCTRFNALSRAVIPKHVRLSSIDDVVTSVNTCRSDENRGYLTVSVAGLLITKPSIKTLSVRADGKALSVLTFFMADGTGDNPYVEFKEFNDDACIASLSCDWVPYSTVLMLLNAKASFSEYDRRPQLDPGRQLVIVVNPDHPRGMELYASRSKIIDQSAAVVAASRTAIPGLQTLLLDAQNWNHARTVCLQINDIESYAKSNPSGKIIGQVKGILLRVSDIETYVKANQKELRPMVLATIADATGKQEVYLHPAVLEQLFGPSAELAEQSAEQLRRFVNMVTLKHAKFSIKILGSKCYLISIQPYTS